MHVWLFYSLETRNSLFFCNYLFINMYILYFYFLEYSVEHYYYFGNGYQKY